jgi:hypothetical protein
MDKENQEFKKSIRDASSNIQSATKTTTEQLLELSESIKKFKIEGLDNFLKFSEELQKGAQKFAALDLSGVITFYSEEISSIAREIEDIARKAETAEKAPEFVHILERKIRDFYVSFYDNIEYLTKAAKKQVIAAKIDKVAEDARKNITNPFIELARHGIKLKKAAEVVQTGIVGMEAGKPITGRQAALSGALLALGQFGEKLLNMTKILDLVSGVFTKVTMWAGGIVLAIQAIISFLSYQRQLEARLGGIGAFRLTPLSTVATEFQKGFQKAIGGVFAGLGAGISQIQDAVAQFLGTAPRLFNISSELIENVSLAFTKAAILGKTFGMSLEESMGNLMRFYSVLGTMGGKVYDIYKVFVGLAARARLSFSELDEIIGNIPQKIMLYGTEAVQRFGVSLSNIIESFGKNIELGRKVATGISSYLNKSLVFQVGIIAAYGNLSRAQSHFMDESYSALGKFFSVIQKNLGTGPMGELAFASALGQFFGDEFARLYFTNEEARKGIKDLVSRGFKDEKKFKELINEIKEKTYEARSMEVFQKQKDLLQYIVDIIEDIRLAINRIVSIFVTGKTPTLFRIIGLKTKE